MYLIYKSFKYTYYSMNIKMKKSSFQNKRIVSIKILQKKKLQFFKDNYCVQI